MSYISINILKESLSVEVKSWLVYDVFERVVQALVGDNVSFYSDFYGNTENGYASDGCGALHVLTTGGNLRGLDITPSISLGQLLDWSSATYGTGWSFENVAGVYRLRVELMEHFYSGGEIIDLTGMTKKGSYKENSYEPLEFNKVTIGYQKYSNEIALNTSFEDFLTKSEYSLPVKTIEGDFSRISPFIASNELIQATFDRRDSAEKWKYDQDVFVIAAVRDGATFVPENDENFDTVTGLDDSATAYNIRLAPVYMLLNQALLINSALFRIPSSAKIQNTEAIINEDFTAELKSTDSCLLGDSQHLERTSIGLITVGNNYEGLRLFNPILHELEAVMTNDQKNTIVDAIEGNCSDSSKDYGFITYTNDDDEIKQIYPLDLQWKHTDKIAKIQGLEKADNYGV